MRETVDALLRGRVVLHQPADGYRVNVDSIWLAHFAKADKRAMHALDLGAGVGAVGLSLLAFGAAARVTLLELDEESCARGERSAQSSGRGGQTRVIRHDVREALPDSLRADFDLVVANPPYGEGASSRRANTEARAMARTAPAGTLDAFVRAARQALGKAGRLCMVYPADRLALLVASLTSAGLHPKRLRMVHPLPGATASVVLVESKPARPGGLRVLSPFIAMREPGRWSDEARRILDGQ